MNADDLAQRIQTLESVEAIKKLKARYCAFCDNQYDADGIAELFTEDAVWDGGKFGRHEGREAIRTFFQGAAEIFPFAVHNVMNPILRWTRIPPRASGICSAVYPGRGQPGRLADRSVRRALREA